MVFKSSRDTLIGNLTIFQEEGNIISIQKTNKVYNDKTNLIDQAFQQLDEYFCGIRKTFDFPIKLKGTDFQKKVWKELMNIPYGSTVSYKFIAKKIGNEKALRAIGNANNKNKLLIVVPCHRVVGSNGKLMGFAIGEEIKEKLLILEKSNKY